MEWNAYHFVGKTLRDGSPVPPDGRTLVFDGHLELCASGFHASRKSWQALEYAPGHTLCRVHCGGQIIEPGNEDKLVCSERTIIRRINAQDLLSRYARLCARDVLHLWDAPEVVVEFLETGNEELRAAAAETAWVAARAAEDAAWVAARSAAETAWVAARAAEDAAWAAAWAAEDAAWAAAWAAEDAAWAAARSAAWAKQRRRFTSMVNQAFEEAA